MKMKKKFPIKAEILAVPITVNNRRGFRHYYLQYVSFVCGTGVDMRNEYDARLLKAIQYALSWKGMEARRATGRVTMYTSSPKKFAIAKIANQQLHLKIRENLSRLPTK